DLRLTPYGREVGLIDDERWERFESRRSRLTRNLAALDLASVKVANGTLSATHALRQPEIRLEDLIREQGLTVDLDPATRQTDLTSIETTVKYAGYLRRQEREVQRAKKDEQRRIPVGFPFDRVPGLSREVVQRLSQVRPDTLGHALRVPGVTPAAIAVLSSYVGRLRDL